MSRKTRAILLAVAAAAAAIAVGANSGEAPIGYPSAWGKPGAPLTGVGANGLVVDPYTVTQEVNSGGCLVSFVPLAEVIARCGDDDGCTLRLTSDTNSSRGIATPRSFVTAADGLVWRVSTGFSSTTSGLNGANPVTQIFQIDSNGCTVWDDFQTTGTDYELRTCNNRSCTLRIDD